MAELHISLAAEPLFHIGSFPVTNSLLASLGAAGVLVGVARAVSRSISAVPGKIQNIAEVTFEWLLGLMDSVTSDRAQTKKFFPFVTTIFLFILTMNWMGLLPIFGTIGLNEIEEGHKVFVPFLRAGTADLNMTVALAMVSVILIQVFGVMYLGVKKHLRKYFNPNPTFTFVGIIEFVSEFTKIISFSFRLFGNVFAGEVLLLVISTLVPLIAPVPFYFLEIFVGFIQAFVFALLTLVFLKISATAEEH
jgi:F-type H+-transporting ATPase subunit a